MSGSELNLKKYMGKSQETFSKKEREKQRARKQQDKREKMQERKQNKEKGKSLNDMIAYLDENGNISATPPDPKKKRVFVQEDIQISVPKLEERQQAAIRTGIVTYYNMVKGFGFINDDETKQRVFVHNSQLSGPVMENDRVQYEIENSVKGPSAVNISKI
jgi:cold shock CspA family protein